MESLFAQILWQDSWAIIWLLVVGGFLVKLLPFRWPKFFGNEKVFAFVNFCAAVCILIGALNLGYKAADNDWARQHVNQQKQEQLQKLQNEIRRGR